MLPSVLAHSERFVSQFGHENRL